MDDLTDELPRRHPLSRRITAAVLVAILVLGAIGAGFAIANYEWGTPAPASSLPPVSAAG